MVQNLPFHLMQLFIGETGRRLGERFREHLQDVERNCKDAPKPIARHFNPPILFLQTHDSLWHFSTPWQQRNPQNFMTKIHLPDRHS